ncbi:GNAT family N-acetyltransferase [Thalassobius sp. MITS945101]|uniref:GNAT family N-acetyltransferase n=1 Tax=Thalassobius sp. MITS945101 TaxID=3096994 RepID=UPI00399AE489
MLSQTSPQLLKLRPATPADHAGVEALLARSYPRLLKRDYPPSTMVTAVPLISRANPTLLASGTYYVIEHEGQILAAGGWTKAAPSRSRGRAGVGHIRHVATDPDHLRQGLGQALMRHVIRDARRSGVTELQCLSTRTALRFYKALGFAEGRELNVPLAQGITFPAIEMWRKLD